HAISLIPMLYGNPESVIEQAKAIIQNESMEKILQNLIDIYTLLKAYGAENSVVFNLGLINNMNYYSGVIFQGFVNSIGKPVLMGGRYDNLSKQFGPTNPAVGFAFEVDLLLHALQQEGLVNPNSNARDIIIRYQKEKQIDALQTAYLLRDIGYQVLTFSLNDSRSEQLARFTLEFSTKGNLLLGQNSKKSFHNYEELLSIIEKEEI